MVLGCALFTVVGAQGALTVGVSALAYRFTTLDVPGEHDTFLYSLNNHGTVVGQGFAADGVSSVGAQFINGQFVPYTAVGTTFYTELDSVNDRGDVGGSYLDDAGNQIAFILAAGTQSDFTASTAALLTVPGGINNERIVAGTFTEDPNFQALSGYVRVGGVVTPFDFPSSSVVATLAFNISENGQVAGWYLDGTGSHGYVKTGASFATIDYPGALLTRVFGINNSGTVVGYYRLVPHGPFYGFVLRGGQFVSVSMPGAVATIPQAINDLGELAGYFLGSDGQYHGFTATPANAEQ